MIYIIVTIIIVIIQGSPVRLGIRPKMAPRPPAAPPPSALLAAAPKPSATPTRPSATRYEDDFEAWAAEAAGAGAAWGEEEDDEEWEEDWPEEAWEQGWDSQGWEQGWESQGQGWEQGWEPGWEQGWTQDPWGHKGQGKGKDSVDAWPSGGHNIIVIIIIFY